MKLVEREPARPVGELYEEMGRSQYLKLIIPFFFISVSEASNRTRLPVARAEDFLKGAQPFNLTYDISFSAQSSN